jgi:small neutral amino acid transporter SnatA (MarC family)
VIIAGGVILTLVASKTISTVTGIIIALVYTGPTVLAHVIIAGGVILTLVASKTISTITEITVAEVKTFNVVNDSSSRCARIDQPRFRG